MCIPASPRGYGVNVASFRPQRRWYSEDFVCESVRPEGQEDVWRTTQGMTGSATAGRAVRAVPADPGAVRDHLVRVDRAARAGLAVPEVLAGPVAGREAPVDPAVNRVATLAVRAAALAAEWAARVDLAASLVADWEAAQAVPVGPAVA